MAGGPTHGTAAPHGPAPPDGIQGSHTIGRDGHHSAARAQLCTLAHRHPQARPAKGATVCGKAGCAAARASRASACYCYQHCSPYAQASIDREMGCLQGGAAAMHSPRKGAGLQGAAFWRWRQRWSATTSGRCASAGAVWALNAPCLAIRRAWAADRPAGPPPTTHTSAAGMVMAAASSWAIDSLDQAPGWCLVRTWRKKVPTRMANVWLSCGRCYCLHRRFCGRYLRSYKARPFCAIKSAPRCSQDFTC